MAVAAAQYRCGDARRRRFVRDASPATINGIDFLEVRPDQKTLEVTFLHNLPGETNGVPTSPVLGIDNVVIDGGVRITDIHVTQVASADDVLTVTVDASGDFSTYVLRLRTSITDDSPPAMFDPQLSAVPFSFKVDCPNDFDCAVPDVCPPNVCRAGDRLPRRTRQLPAADARPDGRACAGRPNGTRLTTTSPSSGARLRRRLPQLLPGRGCDRELPGSPGCVCLPPPHACTARTPAAAPGRGSSSTSNRAAAPTARHSTPEPYLSRGDTGETTVAREPAEAADGGTADRVRDDVFSTLTTALARSASTPGATISLPAEECDARDTDRRPDLTRPRRRRPLRGGPQPDDRPRGRCRPFAPASSG